MKSKKFVLIKNGKIHTITDSSHEKKLSANEIPLTTNEFALIRACNGDLELAKNIIRDIEARIAKVTG